MYISIDMLAPKTKRRYTGIFMVLILESYSIVGIVAQENIENFAISLLHSALDLPSFTSGNQIGKRIANYREQMTSP